MITYYVQTRIQAVETRMIYYTLSHFRRFVGDRKSFYRFVHNEPAQEFRISAEKTIENRENVDYESESAFSESKE